LKASIEAAVQMKAIRASECERVIVDTTVREKAIAHPVDNRLLEVSRDKWLRRWLRRPGRRASH
jgi:IS5 family transposase